mgnify:CR=1 FL=1
MERKNKYYNFKYRNKKSKLNDLEFKDNLVRIWYPRISKQEELTLKNI